MTDEDVPKKILVIDDNEHNRLVVEGHLTGAGYTVELAESGEEGLQRFSRSTPAMVLLDVMMPGMDGFETCRQIKALPAGRDVPVVFLTALSDLGSHQKALSSGADDFLTKPINRTELLIRVRSLLWVKRLRDELSEGYDLIRTQRDALLRAQKDKEELSALVVHDLKNPLSAILANLEYALSDEAVTAETREALADSFDSARTMHRMVMNLLDISRSEDGQLIPHAVSLDFEELVKDVVDVISRRAELERRTMRFSSAGDLPRVHADRDLLRRVVENLLDNALKYSPPDTTIEVEVASVDDAVELRVRDQGGGVPPEYRERIFDKYAQLDRSTAPHLQTSRGLGLAFCSLAAQAHGGRIWVEANAPKGSTFRLRLPLTRR